MELTRRQEEMLERAVTALEALAQDPVIEIEAAPPVCPHCGKFNPLVTVEKDTDGPLGECVLQARCDQCGKGFYAIPVTWEMATSPDEVRQAMSERAEANGNH